jgi:hypothetical protein
MLLWESVTDIFVQDYVLTGYIAEVINTVSNLTYRTPFSYPIPFLQLPHILLKNIQIT